MVITEAGNHPKVVGLVYVAAFAPSEGESVDALIKNPPPGAPVPPILAPQGGRLFLDREKFHAAFAADLNSEETAFMADSQVPWGVDALRGTIGKAASGVKVAPAGSEEAEEGALRDGGRGKELDADRHAGA